MLGLTQSVIGQNDLNNTFDSSNYYNHFYLFDNPNVHPKKLTVAWLQIEDALSVIKDEMKNFGCNSFIKNKLIQLDTSKYIYLSIFCTNKKFGVLYTEDHSAVPKKEHRQSQLANTFFRVFAEANGESAVGKDIMLKLNKLPENIILLTQDCYWYETTGNKKDDKYLVTKQVALRILRQDVKSLLAKLIID